MVLRFSVSAGRREGQDEVVSRPWRVVDVPLGDGKVIIGRRPGSTVELPFPAVSASHVCVRRQDDGYRVEDLGSVNGTRLGNRRLEPGVALPLAPGETLDVAGVLVRFDGELPDRRHQVEDAGTETLARRLVCDVFAGCSPGETTRLVAVDGPGAGAELLIVRTQRALIVGRGEGCDLILHDEDVSREHMSVERTAAGVAVKDLESKNGLVVRGTPVSGPCLLRDEDVVRIGQTGLKLFDPEDRYLRQIQAADAESALRPAESALVTPSAGTAQRSATETPLMAARCKSTVLLSLSQAVAVGALLWVAFVVLALAFAG